MKADMYTATGTKKGTMDLPASLFGAPINEGLIHQALLRQQGNRRSAIAHVKSRGEVKGSSAKLFQQKGTGRARRGNIKSPVLRGGGKAFGPRSKANFSKDMPKNMRRAALRSCLSLQAKEGTIVGLESYPEEIKTKSASALLKKLPVDEGRRVLFVLPERNDGITLSVRNIPGAKSVLAAYLNPEDVLGAHLMVFVKGSVEKVEELFGSRKGVREVEKGQEGKEGKEGKEVSKPTAKKSVKKATTKKTSKTSLPSKTSRP